MIMIIKKNAGAFENVNVFNHLWQNDYLNGTLSNSISKIKPFQSAKVHFPLL